MTTPIMRNILLTAVLAALAATQASGLAGGPRPAQPRMHAIITGTAQNAQDRTPAEIDEYLLRVRPVVFDMTALKPGTPIRVGDIIQLDLLDNASYRIIVQDVSVDVMGTLTILGTIEGQALQTFVLSSDGANVLISLQDVAANRLFRVRYVAKEKAHYALEYDVKNMPPVKDLPPVIPPDEG
ncbi:hypothetical protein GX586_04035 [bacterium]|nr:hypothetical protein [bacterium]